jgi:hypothetical protein
MAKVCGALRRYTRLCKASFLILLIAASLAAPVPSFTLVEVKCPARSRFFLLRDGEEALLTWRNSLFGQVVEERFVAGGGYLWLEGVRFEDQTSGYTMKASAPDLADLYHTGGAFEVEGVHKPFAQVTFRIGVIGEPRLRVKGREIAFEEEAGFGGKVVLRAEKARLIALLRASAVEFAHLLLFW